MSKQYLAFVCVLLKKQCVRNLWDSGTRTLCILASSDGYSYHLIPYSGAKGLGGTPQKDVIVQIVADLVLTCHEGIGNLTSDNWYAYSKLILLLIAMNVPTICTVHVDHIGSAPTTSKTQMERSPHGNYSSAYDDSAGLHCVHWKDNSVVTMLSNCIGPS